MKRFLYTLAACAALVLLTAGGAVAKKDKKGEPKGEHKYELFGTAKDDLDPQNDFNEVISIDTSPAAVGFARRTFRKHTQVRMLDNQVEFKYLLVGRTCGGGAPRIQLTIDGNGDGNFQQTATGPDFVAHGHVNPPLYTACVAGEWRYEDLTDAGMRWEVTPATAFPAIGNFPYDPWDAFETAVQAALPNHQVLRGSLVDDASSFFVAGQGCAYFDIVTIGNRTLSDWHDTKGGKHAPNDC